MVNPKLKLTIKRIVPMRCLKKWEKTNKCQYSSIKLSKTEAECNVFNKRLEEKKITQM